MEELILNTEYLYTFLQDLFNKESDIDPNMEWNELGDDIIGKGFIVVEAGPLTLSFIFSGYNSQKGAYYKLIFKE
jgi:hypothetical protein